MTKTILFPYQPYEKCVDNSYKDEYDAAQLNGFDVILFDFDLFIKTKTLKLSKSIVRRTFVIYRGWMMLESDYELFYNSLLEQNIELINTPKQYTSKHHYPEIYKNKSVQKYCSDSYSFIEPTLENIEKAISNVGSKFILKDFVKSEKGFPDLFIIENKSIEEISKILERFKDERGKLFNAGYVFKKFENITEIEYRVFMYKDLIISIEQNTNFENNKTKTEDFESIEKIIQELDSEFKNSSNFWTIDFAKKQNGEFLILECGDGQVSGLATQENEFYFYQKLDSEIVSI